MKNKIRSQKGFTLVEVMFAILIGSALMAALYMILINGSDSWQATGTKVELRQNVRSTMSWLTDDLREASQFAVSNVPADGNWYTAISFRKAASVSNGNLTWSNAISYTVTGSNPKQLNRVMTGNPSKLIAQNIETFQVRRLASDPNILEFNITALKRTPRGITVSVNQQFKVECRNG